MNHELCPLCAGPASSLLKSESLPCLQNKLYESRAAAASAEVRSLHLWYCGTCHLAFDAAARPPSEDEWTTYDNNQLASATYRTYLDGVVRRIAEVGAIDSSSHVVEPACGSGYVLSEIRRLTGASVRGFDPQYRGEHGVEEWVVPTFFREPTARPADVVVLRHCIESVPDVDAFLRAVVASLRPGGVVYLEATDLDAALRAGAGALFCPEYTRYLSLPAVTRLLGRHDLIVTEARPLFSGDYLEVIARRRPEPTSMTRGLERVESCLDDFDRTVMWGIAGRAVAALAGRSWGVDRVRYGVDQDPRKHGLFVPVTGQRILSPAEAVAFDPELVIVANGVYLAEIRAQFQHQRQFVTLDGVFHG